jgi:hypothetical protein
VTVLRTALYGIGQASTHNVMLDPCRGGTARFSEDIGVSDNPACAQTAGNMRKAR